MLRLLLDPAIFNYIIMGLYVLSSIRWAIAGNPWASLYWSSAFAITISVTRMSR